MKRAILLVIKQKITVIDTTVGNQQQAMADNTGCYY